MKDKITFMAYTDAASYNNGKRQYPGKPEHTCSGGVVRYGSDVIYSFHNYNPNTTISYGELYAIHTLLSEFVPLLEGSKCKLILHTDSEYCFKSINIWSEKWIKNAKKGVWQTPNGAVPYQLMLAEILQIVWDNDVVIKHVSGGHFDVLNPKKINVNEWKKGIKTCKERYLRNNGENISDEMAMTHMFWNNICDQIAKEGLIRGMTEGDSHERKRKSFKKYID